MTGIAIFAYDRPKHLKTTLDAILKNSNHPIYIYVDGPASKEIEKKQSLIFKIIENAQKKRNDIFLIKSSENRGLCKAILNGIRNTFIFTDKIIVIEDDILVNKKFFEFINFWLNEAKNHDDVLSICGYQFPIAQSSIVNKSQIKSIKLPRFMPWGWATWKEKWELYYEENLRKILKTYSFSRSLSDLPSDIYKFCTNEEYLDGIHDTWSIPWTTIHYLARKNCIYPSVSLIENFGFDGTGVHCSVTDIFNTRKIEDSVISKLDIEKKLSRSLTKEIKIRNFLEEKSEVTMRKNKKGIEPYQVLASLDNRYILKNDLKNIIIKTVNNFYIDDIHTHLFPEQFGKYSLKGITNLLNYHYLIPELIKKGSISPKHLNNLSNYKIAEICWKELFINSIPISTATMGVSYILDQLGIKTSEISFKELLEIEKNVLYSDEDIYNLSKIRKIYMTNDPFDKEEWGHLNQNNWSNERYKVSFRLDYILNLVKKNGITEFEKIKDYLNQCIKLRNPEYLSLSINNQQLKLLNSIFLEPFFYWAEKVEKSIFLMIGVKRSVNPDLKLAADGLDEFSIHDLERLVAKYKNIKFYISILDETKDHSLRVLSRKFSNITIAGYWWFTNNKNQISSSMKKRFEMLGTGHKVFYSDSRVTEQIIYKSKTYRNLIIKNLFDLLQEGQQAGRLITEKEINSLLSELFYLND